MGRLDALRKFDKDNSDLDEMMMLSADGKQLQAEYIANSMPVPEWLTSTMKALGREVTSRISDQLEKRKRELTVQRQGRESAEEARTRIDKEIADIDARLGNVPITK